MFCRASKQYPSNILHLTSMRFGAAYIVVIYHCLMRIEEVGFPMIGEYPVLSYGYLGVDFFFILSGFILSHVYKDKFKGKVFSVRHFYFLRLARLYPVHLLIIFVEALYILFFISAGTIDSYHNHTVLSFVNTLFLTHSWGIGPMLCYNCPSWSLSAEWFMYLLFPFIVLPFFRLKLAVSFVLTCCLAVLLFSLGPVIFGKELTKLTVDFGVLRIFPEFIFGMFLYKFGERYSLSFFSKRDFYAVIFLIIIGSYMNIPPFVIVFLFGVLIFLGAEQSRQGLIWGLCKDRAVYLGEISYSTYMLHVPVLQFTILLSNFLLLSGVTFLLAWFSCFGVVVLLAMAMYKYVEVPSRSYLRRISASY